MKDFTKIQTSTNLVPDAGNQKKHSPVFSLILIVLIVAILLAAKFMPGFPKAIEQIKIQSVHKSQNKLVESQASYAQMVNIPVHEMMDFNYKNKKEIYDLRKSFTAVYPQFIDSNYQPSEEIFQQIQDGKPWWGILGRSYYGNGQYSIEGPAEESRFITNPLLLIGLDSGFAWRVNDANIPVNAVYPQPLSLSWSTDHKQALVKYDISTYQNQSVGRFYQGQDKNTLTMIGYNARDLGFHYLYVSPKESQNIVSAPHAVEILQYIHTGPSCGYPGGCNNMSPHQEEMILRINNSPAKAYIKLWRNEPADPSSAADMTYIIEML